MLKTPLGTWFRCLVKEVFGDGDIKYKWHEMTFFTHWLPGHSMFLCIGTPETLKTQLAASLAEGASSLDFSDPFSMHVPMMDRIIALYDRSVWSIRDVIRNREKVYRSGSYRSVRIDLIALFIGTRETT